MKLASLLDRFEESATLKISARAKELVAAGKSVVNFGAGELDFNTPDSIIDAAFAAAKKGQTKYTAVAGNPSTRKALAARLEQSYGLKFSPSEIILSTGGKQAIFHFLQTVCEPQDEVIIFSPYWVSFPEMVKVVGAKPVIVDAIEGFSIEKFKKALSPKTKAIILNSPSNPSGTVWTESELRLLLEEIKTRDLWVLSDDTYLDLVYEPKKFISLLHLDPSLKSKVVIVGSASKSYAMTGWRIGWAVGPAGLIEGMVKLQSQVTSGPNSLSQAALEEAVGPSFQVVAKFREILQKRKDLMMGHFAEMKGVRPLSPDGAFYVFADFSEALGLEDVTDFAVKLLEDYGVCAIPGIAFGDARFLRFSYACSEADIAEGLKRVKQALQAAKKP